MQSVFPLLTSDPGLIELPFQWCDCIQVPIMIGSNRDEMAYFLPLEGVPPLLTEAEFDSTCLYIRKFATRHYVYGFGGQIDCS